LSEPEPPVAELSRLVREAQAEQRIPSVSAAAVHGDEIVWEEALGLADVEAGEEATPATQYRVGSITKTFTAVAVMQLRDEGRLELDDPVGKHLADVGRPEPTLRRMLAHLSGLQREPPGDVWESLRFPTREELVSQLAQAEQVLPPGARWHYSNLAFALLGEVVARLSGLEYEHYVRERIIEPLQLERTAFEPSDPVATPYLVDAYADRVRREPTLEKSSFAAAGSLWSTAADLCRWGNVLTRGHKGVLAEATAEEMRTFQALADIETWKLGWGLGVMLMREGDRVFVGHGGAMPGFLAGLAVSPKENAGIAVLVNSGAGVKIDQLTRGLATKVAEAYPPEPEPWRPSAPPPELEGVLGRWWTEGAEVVIRWSAGKLELRVADTPPALPPSVFEPEGPERFRGVSGPEQGELLRIVRDGDGHVTKLYWATYPLTRDQKAFG
jgi:CubicO group peptidase (beta-lactamase class C family)